MRRAKITEHTYILVLYRRERRKEPRARMAHSGERSAVVAKSWADLQWERQIETGM